MKKTDIILFVLLIICGTGFIFFTFSRDNDESVPAVVTHSETASETTVATSVKSSPATVTSVVSKTKKASATSVTSVTPFTSLSVTSRPEYVFPADINKVSKEQLMEIDGIGEVTAGKIIEYRSTNGGFHSLWELTEIDGIGEKTYNHLCGFLYVSEDMTVTSTSASKTSASAPNTSEVTTAFVKTTMSAPKITTSVTTTFTTTVTTEVTPPQTTPEPVRRTVNINKASAEEISECLLIDIPTAEAIVYFRENSGGYKSAYELILIDDLGFEDVKMSYELFNQIKDYCLVE